MFELEVGNNRSPQRLLVTVETDNDEPPTAETRRRLFPSPSPFSSAARPRLSATTTTVPLKDSIEYDDDYTGGIGRTSTPKKRGRPRKNNGTPIPSAAKKRRAGTPMKRTPKRQNTIQDPDPLSDQAARATPTPRRRGRPSKSQSVEPASEAGAGPELMSDNIMQATPTPKRRGRPPKNRPVEPSSEIGKGSTTKAGSARGGRKRRQALAPSELEEMVEEPEVSLPTQPTALPVDDGMHLIEESPLPASQPPTIGEEDLDLPEATEPGSDIWMAALEDEPTPRPKTRVSQNAPGHTSAGSVERSPSASLESLASQADGFGDGFGDEAASVSDALSAVDEPLVNATRRNDTVAQEDFSMIFMDSIPSLQDFRSSVPGPLAPAQEVGERTNLIINNTLESLRQETEVEASEAQQRGSEAHESGKPWLDEPDDAEQPAGSHGVELIQGELEGTPEPAAFEEQAESSVALEDAGAAEADLGGFVDANYMQETHKEAVYSDDVDAVDVVNQPILEGEAAENELSQLSENVALPSQQDEPDELSVEETTSVKASSALSSHQINSPLLSRSPRKANISPLRRQVLNSARKTPSANPALAGLDAYGGYNAAGSSTRRSSTRHNEEDSNMYEDSFSEIPEVVLEAATPRRPAVAPVITIDDDEEEDEQDMDDDEESHGDDASIDEDEILDHVNPEDEAAPMEEEVQDEQRSLQMEAGNTQALPFETTVSLAVSQAHQHQPSAASVASSTVLTDNGRLPTPDDTPPNLQGEDGESPEKSTQQSQQSVVSSPAEPHSQLMSEQDATLHNEPHASQYLEAPRPPVERGSSAIEVTPANQLSSPVQNILSPAVERSPGNAPRPALSAIVRAGRVLQSVTSDPPSPEAREKQLGSPFRSSASKESWSGSREPTTGSRMSASPSRRSLGHRRQSASIDRLDDDPFGVTSRSTGQGSFMEALGRSVHEPTNKSRTSPIGSAASSMRITPPGDEMSWVAEAGPIDSNLRGDNSLREVAKSSAFGAMKDFHPQAPQPPLFVAPVEPVEDESSRDGAPARDDETDIWEVEAQREEPDSAQKEQSFSFMSSAPLHRRPAIPSPWTKKASIVSGLGRSTDPAVLSTEPEREHQHNPEGETEEFSLLTQRQDAHEAGTGPRAPESAARANRFDLSSFFSSPAAIPSKLAQKFFPSKTRGEGTQPPSATAVPTSSMFPPVPQKAFEPQSDSRADLFSPSRSSAARESVAAESPKEPEVDHGSASPETPERLEMPVVAQKKNFTPRPRQTNQAVTNQSVTKPVVAPAVTPTPPRMQLSHADIHRWQQETSHASQESPKSPERLLRPLPPRNASPTKSSLRSPLKPHTPGRVVEFTSSVLSPMDQAKQRRLRMSINAGAPEPGAPEHGDVPQPDAPAGRAADADDKENQDSDVSMSDASPDKTVQRPETLSQTLWTRQHWLFLDKLIQHRRQAPFGVQVESRAGKYLGKTVKSHGESMVLEQWHIDCVDAFKAVVGGWDEGALAKRLFALIIGEEKRQRIQEGGKKPMRASMFH